VTDSKEASYDDNGGNHSGSIERVGHSSEPVSGALAYVEPGSSTHQLHAASSQERGDVHATSGAIAAWQYRESPWPDPNEIAAYHQIDPVIPREIMAATKANQDAQIEAMLTPVRAEAWALKAATFGGTFLPWFCFAGAGILVVLGHEAAATVGAIMGAASGGVQIARDILRKKH